MPSRAAPPPPAPVARHSFVCARCDGVAGVVQLFGPASSGELTRDSFTSSSTYVVSPENFERLRAIITAGDAGALYEYDLEAAPFYCPVCRACYCGDHWARWNVFDDEEGFTWHDSIRGRCPLGHGRMLED